MGTIRSRSESKRAVCAGAATADGRLVAVAGLQATDHYLYMLQTPALWEWMLTKFLICRIDICFVILLNSI